ncbi:MAG TPA: hypothetical protein VLO07_09600, partial [Thermoanaerobaculia bacterium]|nr:hypothetical protein [Thermoanaerobaculia bacterium]
SRRQRVETGTQNPRDVKADLARILAAQFHGEKAATRAEEDFRRAFSKGELPEVLERKNVAVAARDWGAAQALVEVGLAKSMREARRKIAEGALSIYGSGSGYELARVVRNPNEKIFAVGEPVLRLGRRFLHVSPGRSRS